MSKETEVPLSDEKRAAVKTLEMMLDYAMLEGAELRSPLFVMLLRLARLALIDEFECERPRTDRRRAQRTTESTEDLRPQAAV
jgi:hypothetical protein